MGFYIAILYSAVLGVLFEHSFCVDRSAAPDIRVMTNLSWRRAHISLSLYVVFLVDWITFHLQFPTASTSPLPRLDLLLLTAYIPAVMCLGSAVVYSYNTSPPTVSVGGKLEVAYLFISTIGETLWMMLRLNAMPSDTPGLQTHYSIVILYLMSRYGFTFLKAGDLDKQHIAPPIFWSVVITAKGALVAYLAVRTDLI